MRTSASEADGEGFGTELLRKRDDAGPLPFFMSVVRGYRLVGVRVTGKVGLPIARIVAMMD